MKMKDTEKIDEYLDFVWEIKKKLWIYECVGDTSYSWWTWNSPNDRRNWISEIEMDIIRNWISAIESRLYRPQHC